MLLAGREDTWRGLYASGLLSRFIVLCIGYAVGAAVAGITANLSGLAAGISIAAAKAAAFWVFAAFTPLLVLALLCAWAFTKDVQSAA